MKKSLMRLATISAAIAVVGAVAVAAPATATPAVATSSTPAHAQAFKPAVAPSSANPFCWGETDTGLSTCAPTQEALVRTVRNDYGRVIVADGVASSRITALTAASANADVEARSLITGGKAANVALAPMATYVWGIVYMDKNYGGLSWTDTTSIVNPCSHGYTSDYENMYFGQIYNDNVESEETVGACSINLYVDNDGQGSATGWITSKGDIGPLRNLISSWRFR